MTLGELEKLRGYECRLTPDRALGTLGEAEAFLRDRGLLTRTADSALPSLFEACHEEPYARDSPGFGQWPATTFPWFGRLGARGHLILAVHRGKSLLVTSDVADLLDPICRAELARMEAADEGWARLLRHLADAGPSELQDLQIELGLSPRELKSLRSSLAGTRSALSRAALTTRDRRSATSSAPACAPPSSLPSGRYRAGSRGGGTGTTASWTSSSLPGDSSVSTATSQIRLRVSYTPRTTFHRFGEMGLRAHFL